ncbi:MAG: TIGR02452 family protein [Muribaculaceae bacterium]|nr:TIGR02452 family protein [Muribaculaceae bacterium]
MKRQFTPETISELAANEIFVFGSNPAGYHVGGAAKMAVRYFGATYGQSEGLQGQSYAIPTIFPRLDMIKPHVDEFIQFATKHPDLNFLVTPIGCGNAGYTAYDIAPLFVDAYDLKNVILSESFVYVIENHPRMTGNPLNSWNSHMNFLNLKRYLENSTLYNRDEIRKIYVRTFLNTVQIVNSGFYLTEDGKKVELNKDQRLTDGTTFYDKEFSVSNVPSLNDQTIIEVTERDCLKEAVRLSKEGLYPAVLNMANRRNPGGGVLHGSRAQEESIFRRTSLFRSLYQFAPYAGEFGLRKSELQYPLDKNFGGVYSPDVILFRDSEKHGCKLLDNPEYVSVITVAAMNRPEIDSMGKISGHLIEGVKNKIRTIFRIALRHCHDSLVLGAWGCGAFCNPPEHIASLFHEVLNEMEFKNKFRKIVFAILEDHNSRKAHNPEGNLRPFQKEFCMKN